MNHPRHSPFLNKTLALTGLVLLPAFGWWLWCINTTVPLLSDALKKSQTTGAQVLESLTAKPALAFIQEASTYQVKDDLPDGIQISYPSSAKALEGQAQSDTTTPLETGTSLTGQAYSLTFPKTYTDPIKVTLPGDKSFSFRDTNGKDSYRVETLSDAPNLEAGLPSEGTSLLERLFPKGSEQKYLRYTDTSGRKSLYYAYHKDSATGERELKHWTIYEAGTGEESESYSFDNATLKKNDNGSVSVYYTDPDALKNQEGAAGVDTNLLERAQRVLAQDATENGEPDATIPAPYVLDKDGTRHDLSWEVSEDRKSLSVSLSLPPDLYPLGLDPTLSFTAPGQSNTGDTITGETAGDYFGQNMVAGDWNNDGKIDLAVSAGGYSAGTGRVYLFYNDGEIESLVKGADYVITGAGIVSFGAYALGTGDLNTDGRADLIVTAGITYSTPGLVYIFYNDGSLPTTAATADVTITGENTGDGFGGSVAVGDFNVDGLQDFIVGASGYSSGTGRAYIFYNDGSYPSGAGSADVIINGEGSSNSLGYAVVSGDFNADGKTDLVVGASGYGSNNGRVYVFYTDGTNNYGTATCTGSAPTACLAANADAIITGSGDYLGYAFTAGDLNADGKTDLVVGGRSNKVFIFYNGAITTEAASGADVTITQSVYGYFGVRAFGVADFNGDGRVDLAVSSPMYNGNPSPGRIYIFYNDGSYPSDANGADVIVSSEYSGNSFGNSIASGDFNSDGKTDFAFGAEDFASSRGRAYIFYSQNGQVNTNQTITGGATSDEFSKAMTTGDFNADGRIDLAVSAPGYNPGGAGTTGRVYLFYGDGQISTAANSADIIITGEAVANLFGIAVTAGDFNADGKTDLVVGAQGYSTSSGRAYIFYNGSIITENASGADILITGEGVNNYFGYALSAGDFNADGKTDLVSGAYRYNSYDGRAYMFYSGSIITENASGADVIITGGTGYEFGVALVAGDFNADGKTDLAAGAQGFGASSGVALIFYNDGSYPSDAANAETYWIGVAIFNYFGASLATGDFNSDGKTDLAVGAYGYSTSTGRTYIFYNDGSYPTGSASADVIISGEASSKFGRSLTVGDFNADGRTDLVVGGDAITSNTGKAYIFYNDGSIPTTAATADVMITGETTSNYFGYTLTAGDMNGDGRTDLIASAYGYSTSTGRVYIYETRENFAWQLQKQSPTPAAGGLRVGVNGSGEEMKIDGEAGSSFGFSMTSGDFNVDGKMDLAVGGSTYNSNGRVYIFYNDGSLSASATSADVVITGEALNNLNFGYALVSADFNADGRTDLAVGSNYWNGKAYVFYNDGVYPAAAASADAIITDAVGNNSFGNALSAVDFNLDGKTDLIVGAPGYSGDGTGRVYVFYSGSITTENNSGADVFITGNAASDNFGQSFTTGDFNVDGKIDLAIGAFYYSTGTGRVYLFYIDGTVPTTAATADVTITGEGGTWFGYALTSGDMNADGKTDLVANARFFDANAGRVYIFYNDGTIPTTAATADVFINGYNSFGGLNFGSTLQSADMNGDGRTDLVAGFAYANGNYGAAAVIYNDGSYPTSAATADVVLVGEQVNARFGTALAVGDFNADGKMDFAVGATDFGPTRGRIYMYTMNDPVITGSSASDRIGLGMTTGDFNADGKIDLAVGATGYSTNTGRVYLFYNDGALPGTPDTADVIITGGATSDQFGYTLAAGDLNADGRTDLAVAAIGYTSQTGRVYIFYNDGSIPTTAGTADVIITGGATGDQFGYALATSDLNADSKTDLAVGAYGYSSSVGRAYLFYNDGSIPTTAGTADVIWNGEATSFFGRSFAVGDFNADGRTDIAVGANAYSAGAGRIYLFYNDGTYPAGASAADLFITGEASAGLGAQLTSGDFNADGRTDILSGANTYASSTGRAYIFYNDGSIPTTAATADVIITGGATGDTFGNSLGSGDLNGDGKTDVVIGAYNYSTQTGRVYLFYNDGSIPTTAGTADVIINGEATSNDFGICLSVSDLNSDGKTDLAIGADGYSSNKGRVYIITSEAAVETSPNMTRVKGTVKTKGTVKIK